VDTRTLLIKSDADRKNLWLEGPNLTTLRTNHTKIPPTHISVHEVRVLSHNSQVDTDHIAFTPASLLTPVLHLLTPTKRPHDTEYLHEDNRIESAISPRFWYRWDKIYLPLYKNVRNGLKLLITSRRVN